MPVRNRFAELHDEIAAWRQDFHAHPELQFDVHETAAFVQDRLTEFGVDDITPGIGQTGVVGVITGKTNTSGRVIGLRADMDALRITDGSRQELCEDTTIKIDRTLLIQMDANVV